MPSPEIRSFLQRPPGEYNTAPPAYRLTEGDARLVKGMLLRGDKQHDIATYFGVNAGRIADIATGRKFQHVSIAGSNRLPPPGPYDVRKLLAENKRLRGNK